MTSWFVTPSERHRTGIGGSSTAIGAVVGAIGGVIAVFQASWLALLLFVGAAIIAREAYLCYKAGNWP